MKRPALSLLASVVCLPLVHGELKSKFAASSAQNIEHCWSYGLAQFSTKKEDLEIILTDSLTWLKKNEFVEVKLADDIVARGKKKAEISRWYAKEFEGEGRIIIELAPTGYCSMTVESYQKSPANALFRARMTSEYESFAILLNAHSKNLDGMGAAETRKAIGEKVAYLKSKAENSEQGTPAKSNRSSGQFID